MNLICINQPRPHRGISPFISHLPTVATNWEFCDFSSWRVLHRAHIWVKFIKASVKLVYPVKVNCKNRTTYADFSNRNWVCSWSTVLFFLIDELQWNAASLDPTNFSSLTEKNNCCATHIKSQNAAWWNKYHVVLFLVSFYQWPPCQEDILPLHLACVKRVC